MEKGRSGFEIARALNLHQRVWGIGMGENSDQNLSDDLEETGDFSGQFFEYLGSEKGHQLVSRIVALVEEIKKSTIDKNARIAEMNVEYAHKHNARFQLIQAIVYIVVIIASCLLAYFEKFNPALGLLFGTIVGYFFGRKPNQ